MNAEFHNHIFLQWQRPWSRKVLLQQSPEETAKNEDDSDLWMLVGCTLCLVDVVVVVGALRGWTPATSDQLTRADLANRQLERPQLYTITTTTIALKHFPVNDEMWEELIRPAPRLYGIFP